MLFEKLFVDGKILFYYSPIVWIEIMSEIHRMNKIGVLKLDRREIIERIMVVEDTFIHINPSPEAIGIAYLLRELGHRDMIDNVLYCIALNKNLLFMTMDERFRGFLESENMDTSIVISHRELFNRAVHVD